MPPEHTFIPEQPDEENEAAQSEEDEAQPESNETGEPSEPQSKTAKIAKTIAICGGVALGTALAATVAIPAAVGALGFSTGGIVAGSWGAWMMSLGGGVTPAIVSVCQSIGATGAIAASTQVAAGVAGADVTAGIAHMKG